METPALECSCSIDFIKSREVRPTFNFTNCTTKILISIRDPSAAAQRTKNSASNVIDLTNDDIADPQSSSHGSHFNENLDVDEDEDEDVVNRRPKFRRIADNSKNTSTTQCNASDTETQKSRLTIPSELAKPRHSQFKTQPLPTTTATTTTIPIRVATQKRPRGRPRSKTIHWLESILPLSLTSCSEHQLPSNRPYTTASRQDNRIGKTVSPPPRPFSYPFHVQDLSWMRRALSSPSIDDLILTISRAWLSCFCSTTLSTSRPPDQHPK